MLFAPAWFAASIKGPTRFRFPVVTWTVLLAVYPVMTGGVLTAPPVYCGDRLYEMVWTVPLEPSTLFRAAIMALAAWAFWVAASWAVLAEVTTPTFSWT